jgi:NADPH-dependent 7-cyano-7-deazaguanine reductase QueF
MLIEHLQPRALCFTAAFRRHGGLAFVTTTAYFAH